MSKKIIYVISGILFYTSCALPTINKNISNSQISFDTLRYMGSKNITTKNDKCFSPLQSYQFRFGIFLSDYYVIKDSLSIDLNNDRLMDTILILSPLSLEPIDTNCSYKFDKNPKRLLVEVISKSGKSKIRGIYSNLVSDIGGVLSHYNGIFKTENGFKIAHEAGAKYSWSYIMEFSIKSDRLTLVKVVKKCSLNHKEKDIIYTYDNIPLSNINLPDTLSHQCNCDAFWSELEN